MVTFISVSLSVLSLLIIGYTFIKSRSRMNISMSDIDRGIVCYICKDRNEFIKSRQVPDYSYEQYKKRACKSCQRDALLDNVLSNKKLSIKSIIPNNYSIFGIITMLTAILTILLTSFFPKISDIGQLSSTSILLIGSIFIHYGFIFHGLVYFLLTE